MSRKRKGNPRFAVLRAKSTAYWAKFAIFFSLTGYVAYLSFIHAVANILWQPNPDMALRYVPDHPLALSRKADELFLESQSPATLAKVETMAKHSLRGGALNPVAIRLLGFVAEVRGDKAKARELMLLSQKVSRRDLGTQLWLIEDAVARGDKKQALYHYDIALRTTPSSFSLLLPTLVGALDDPQVRSGLVPYLRSNPDWLSAFLSEAINSGVNIANVADVIAKAGGLSDREDYRNLSNVLLANLADKNQFPAYRQYYLSLKGSSAATLESVGLDKFNVGLPYRSAGWQMADNPGIGATFTPFDRSGKSTLMAFAGSGERGELMRKLLFLAPGSYKFSASYDAVNGNPDSDIRWEMQCLSADGNRTNWFTEAPVRKGASSAAVDFDVTADCRYQLLTLQLAGGSSQTGMEFTLRSVNIERR